MDYIRQFFPTVYDLKIIVAEMNDLKSGSLSKLAMDLDIRRTGSQHQAGSDSLLTLLSFCKMKSMFFPDGFSAKMTNKIYGLSNETGLYIHSTYTSADYQSSLYNNNIYNYYTSSYGGGTSNNYYNGYDTTAGFGNSYYGTDLSSLYYGGLGVTSNLNGQAGPNKYLNSGQQNVMSMMSNPVGKGGNGRGLNQGMAPTTGKTRGVI